jgi:hypothetical protein
MSRRSDARAARQAAKAHQMIAANLEVINSQRRRTARAILSAAEDDTDRQLKVLVTAVTDAEKKLGKAVKKGRPSVIRKRQKALNNAQAAQQGAPEMHKAAIGRIRKTWKTWL